jgi:hypothetical protein
MSLELVNVGNVVNDGTGDDLYAAFSKVNSNFQYLDFVNAQNNTASNLGSGIGIYSQKIGSDLRFKSLLAGTGTTITSESNDIVITGTNSFSTITGDTGSYTAANPLSSINFHGNGGVTIGVSGNTVTFSASMSLVTDTNPRLGGNLNLNGHDITGTSSITAGSFFGTLTGNVNGNLTGNVTGNLTGLVNNINVAQLAKQTRDFDFGPIAPYNINPQDDFIDWLKYNIKIDLGSFNDPMTTIGNGTGGGSSTQVNADWNAVSGVAAILNKPSIPSPYSLPTATPSTLGGVKVDNKTIVIDGAGIISTPGLGSRTTVSVVTSSLAAGASTIAYVTVGKSYVLYSIGTSSAAWVVVYANTATSSADSTRMITTDPTPGSGVMAEGITTSNSTQYFTPAVVCYNNESPVTTSIPLKIYNNGNSPAAITVTLTYMVLEI